MITRNRTLRSGIVLIGDHNTLSGNYVAGTAHCPDDVCGEGGAISFEGGTGNVIEQNLVERTLEPGIRVAAFEPETPPADGNAVRHNAIRGALDGIRVQETASHTLLDGNLAVGSADDGIDVDNAATTLRRNVADRNDDLGIEAVAGVTDGGHNRAHGNGEPRAVPERQLSLRAATLRRACSGAGAAFQIRAPRLQGTRARPRVSSFLRAFEVAMR